MSDEINPSFSDYFDFDKNALTQQICINSTKSKILNKFISMDIKDYEGITKYKIIIPMIFVCSWICMILGPLYFDVVYQRMCALLMLYLCMRVALFFVSMIIINIKSQKIFKRASNQQVSVDLINHSDLEKSKKLYHGIILPNFNEDIEMLAETLDVLAAHKRAKEKYLVFLAMEARQEGSELKAQELINRYRQKFRLIDYTRHEQRPFEQRAKAANESWCAEHLQPKFEKEMIDPDQVFLTVMDADSWAPDLYFDILEEEIIKNYEKRHTIIFQPPQIFTRNNLNVPIMVRVFDLMNSYIHCSNLFSFFDFTFAVSNYTLSFKLLKRVGFWDTCADAIGEDFHICQKIYWKTNGDMKTIPIYVPFNQVNLSTGEGYVEDLIAKFWQSQRHNQACGSLAWGIKQFLNSKFRLKNLVIIFQVFDIYALPSFAPWIFISLELQKHILYQGVPKPKELMDPFVFQLLFNFLAVVSTLSNLLYEIFKRRANKIIYRQENQSILRVIEYQIVTSINIFLINVPTSFISALMVFKVNRQWFLAPKKNATQKIRTD